MKEKNSKEIFNKDFFIDPISQLAIKFLSDTTHNPRETVYYFSLINITVFTDKSDFSLLSSHSLCVMRVVLDQLLRYLLEVCSKLLGCVRERSDLNVFRQLYTGLKLH